VLDLDPGVHLEEVVVALGVEQALDGACIAISDRARRLDRDLADPFAQRLVDCGRGRLLDELLVATLDRAVALAEMDDVAVIVGEHLHLDVPRVFEVPLDIHGGVREVRLALPPGGIERTLGLVRAAHDLEAFTTASGRGLDRQRPAELVPEQADVLGRRDRLGRPGHDRDAGGPHRLARRDLRAHGFDRLGRRPDPDDAGLGDGPCEAGVLGQKAVAGMQSVGAGAASGVEEPFLVQIALGGGAGPDDVRLRRHPYVQRFAVGLGVDGDRRDLQLAQRAEDPNRDLAAVGDENL
jgi:hypothetical protein